MILLMKRLYEEVFDPIKANNKKPKVVDDEKKY